MGVTGTGDGGYIDALYYEIEQAFLSQPNASTRQLKELFGQRLATFYKEHVAPFCHAPEQAKTFVSLVIAVHRKKDSRMWVTDLNTLTPVLKYKTLGIGEGYANHLLGIYFM